MGDSNIPNPNSCNGQISIYDYNSITAEVSFQGIKSGFPAPHGSAIRNYERKDAPINPPLTRDDFGLIKNGCCGCPNFNQSLDGLFSSGVSGDIVSDGEFVVFTHDGAPDVLDAQLIVQVIDFALPAVGSGNINGNVISNFNLEIGNVDLGMRVTVNTSGKIFYTPPIFVKSFGDNVTTNFFLSRSVTIADDAIFSFSPPNGCSYKLVADFHSFSGLEGFSAGIQSPWFDKSLLVGGHSFFGSGAGIAGIDSWSLNADIEIA